MPMPTQLLIGPANITIDILICLAEENHSRRSKKVRIMLLGRSKAGKSTIVNAILKEDKIITSLMDLVQVSGWLTMTPSEQFKLDLLGGLN